MDPPRPAAIDAASAPPRTKPSNYPEPFASRMANRVKRPLGDLFGLKSFGVNLTTIAPGAVSSLHHRHSASDEFVYVLEGEPTLVAEDREVQLRPGMCAGFAANRVAHHLENRTRRDVVVLEIGDRSPADDVTYPTDDIQAAKGPDGRWRFTRKDGTAY